MSYLPIKLNVFSKKLANRPAAFGLAISGFISGDAPCAGAQKQSSNDYENDQGEGIFHVDLSVFGFRSCIESQLSIQTPVNLIN
jgi:hypothetical protein